ncbi:DUF4192 domain-containing protein [Nocardia iowensis]|uniref:DUF4192 domain-containing protein n=1 Tax=Nocardia iowensis TaxID=204891 RepID=A0ABX8RYQ1_NOCIO|nr:DUF4192 domain-containing protein [Nocardia iowensis]QXN94777.1 DUF4192 domain-containing protein [Nocardia iowensis]
MNEPEIKAAVQEIICADPAAALDPRAARSIVPVNDPGEQIAEIPALIGFPPQRSLVTLILRTVHGDDQSAVVDSVMRFDLDPDRGRVQLRADMVASCIAQVSAHDGMTAVLAVVVDDRIAGPEPSAGDRCGPGRFEVLVADLARHLAAEDISLAGAWAVQAIEPQKCWWTLFGPEQAGGLPDPAASVWVDSKPMRGSGAELAAIVAEDTDLQQQVAALLDSALALARVRQVMAVRRGDPTAYSRQALEYVLWQITSVESGEQLMAPELAELAVALRDRSVRDAMLALPDGEHAAAAETVWSLMTRAHSDTDRAEAAALLGYSAYVRGDGPLAGTAFEAALRADPEHSMAQLLETSLTVGIPPEQIRRLARSGFHSAADLGIDLGEPRRSTPSGSTDTEPDAR